MSTNKLTLATIARIKDALTVYEGENWCKVRTDDLTDLLRAELPAPRAPELDEAIEFLDEALDELALGPATRGHIRTLLRHARAQGPGLTEYQLAAIRFAHRELVAERCEEAPMMLSAAFPALFGKGGNHGS